MRKFAVLALALGLGVGCVRGSGKARSRAAKGQAACPSYQVRYDQVGYPVDAERSALVLSQGLAAPKYRIVDDATSKVVAEGQAGPRVLDTTSRTGARLTGDSIDLKALPAGRYRIAIDDGSTSGPFTVGANVYAPILPLVTKFLAQQRCGPTTKAASLHGACHLFESTSSKGHSGDGIPVEDGSKPPFASRRPVDAEGGWHDAGDHLKFVGTTAFLLAVESMALCDHRAALGPAGDALAAELRWGMDWLLKMVAGEKPYHQVGAEADHEAGWRFPEKDTETPIAGYDDRPLFEMAPGRGRNLLGRSSAAFSFGSCVYHKDQAYAQRLLSAAKSTYTLAKARPGVQNPDPPDFYEERTGTDDLVLAGAALARVTRDPKFAAEAYESALRIDADPGTAIGWDSLDALALLEAGRAFPKESKERAELGKRLEGLAAPIAKTARTAAGPGGPYGYALPKFGNGSIAESLGAAATCLAARRLNGTAGCDVVARNQLHWMLGRNPFGLSFLVGAGSVSPRNLHHAFAQAAQIAIPGAIPGGPTTLKTLLKSELPPPSTEDSFAAWSTDELLYEDKTDNYVCNEPAIDFTAALVFSLAELAD